MIPSPSSTRKSERLEKRALQTPAVRRKSERVEKQRMLSPLRRSGRTKNHSSSNPSGSKGSGSSSSKQKPKEEKSVKKLTFEAKKVSENEKNDAGTSQVLLKRTDARVYRAIFKKANKDCHDEINRTDKSTQEGVDTGGGKTDAYFKRSHFDCEEVSKDGIMPSEDAEEKEMRADSRLSGSMKELLENYLVPSNASNNETREAPERVQADCCRQETRGEPSCKFDEYSCSSSQRSQKIRHFDGSVERLDFDSEDIANKRRKVINNVDQPSTSENERLSTGNEEGKSGDPVDSPRDNDVEYEEIRKLCDEQRSLYLSLKPEIEKLCEILLLPDDVKSMVDNFFKYIMNNHRVNRESMSVLQAFQISVCWTAASLVKYKLDHKASIMLAQRDLNFDCTKEEVEYIYSMLRCLKKIFLYHSRNSNVTGSPKASEPSNRVYSYKGGVQAQDVELAKKDVSKSIKEIQKKCQKLKGKLCLMQQKERQKLKEANEAEKADFERRYKIELGNIRSCSPNEVVRTEKLKVFNSEYDKIIEELKCLHETRLKELEARQLPERLKIQGKEATWVQQVKFWAGVELDIDISEEPGTGIEYLQTSDQALPHNGPKSVALVSDHVAEGKSFEQIVEAMRRRRTGTGVGLSEAPDTKSPVVALCISPGELQTPPVKHAGTNEMDIMASEDGSVCRNKGHNIAENEHDIQGNIISKHSHSREQKSDGATSMADEGERCENFSCESSDVCGEDIVTLALPSSNGEICDGETSDVPSGEVALAVCKSSSSNDVQDNEFPSSRQEKLDGTIFSKAVVCGFSSGEVGNSGFSDGVKNMVSLNSQSSEEHIPSAISMCVPNCENAVQIQKADDNNGSENTDTLNSPLSNERIASLNSKSPEEHIPRVTAMCMPNCENSAQIHMADDGNGSNNAVTLNSPLSDERIANGARAIVSVLDREVPAGLPGTVNFTRCPENISALNPPPSMEQISAGAGNVSVLDRELSTLCGTASPSNGADAITLLNQPLAQQNPNGVSSSIPAGQIPVDVPETNHEGAMVSVLDSEVPVEMPGTASCTDYPDNATPLNSSPMGQTSDRGSVNVSVLDRVLSSRPCGASSPINDPATISLLNLPSLQFQIPDRASLSMPDGQIPVRVPETSHEVAESHNDREQLTDGVLGDTNATSDQREGVCRTMTEYTLSQETPVSRPVNAMDPLEQVQLSLSEESPPEKDTAGKMLNPSQQAELVSSPADMIPANQSNLASLVTGPPEQVQQLPSAEFLSSNQHPSNLLPLATDIEHQPNNEDTFSSHIHEASIEVRNQAVVQPALNLELDSRSNQAVMHPFSNLDLDSLTLGGVRTQPSLVTEPPEQMQQLPSAEFLSSSLDPSNQLHLATGIEHQPTNEATLSSYTTEALVEVPNQAVVQPASNVELDSRSNQAAVHPISNSDLDSLMPGGVRTQPSDTRNLSTPSEICSHPMQTAAQSASRMLPPLCCDPLKNELERMYKLTEQNMKNHENMKLQLKSNFEKEFEELHRKYDIKFQEIEFEFQQTKKSLDTSLNTVLVNKILADAFRSKCMDLKVSGASGMQQDASFAQQLLQFSRQQNSIWPSMVAGPSSCGPPPASLQSSSTMASSRTVVPPIQDAYNASGIFSSVSARLARVNSISSPSGNVQDGGEIRAPAPHLQPYRPSTSVPASSLPTVPHGMRSQPAPSSIPATSSSLSHLLPRLTPTTYQSDPHRGHWSESAVRLPAPNFSCIDLHMDANSQSGINLPKRMSDVASLNQSRVGTSTSSILANSAYQATSPDVVCLSDDD